MKSQAPVPHSSTFERRLQARQSEIALRELDNKLSSLMRVTKTLETQDLSGQFVAIVSHDLRTPLSSVQMSIDMISNGLFGEINESGKQQLKRAQRSIERMNALINDLLDLERLKSGSFSINPEPLQLDTVIEQAIEATEFHAKAHGLSLIFNKSEDKCFADGSRVLQVLINLIDNAIKFSKVGQTIEIKSERVRNYLEIQVTDRGRGIPKHMQSAIFERFVQTSRKDRLKRNGSGLGLTICREIVLNHGGKIGVRSKPGYGSTFWFRLPIDPPGVASAFRLKTKSGESGRKNGNQTVAPSIGYSQSATEAAQPHCPKSVMAECVSFSTVPSKELPLLKFQQCLIEAAMAVTPVTVSRRSDSFGQMELREQLQEFLWRRRGIACSPEQIVIFHSTEGGLDLLCRLTLRKDDFVAVEDPCFPGIGMNLASNGIDICPVPLDDEGISFEALNNLSRIPSFVYVTPAHQDTLGLTMSGARRLQLLDWASRNGTLIVEDDYGSEFNYDHKAPNAILSLDKSESVVYKYNFWKALYPLLRISFMIIPTSMIPLFRTTLDSTSQDIPYLEQIALSLMIKNGHYERHLNAQQELYEGRRSAMIRAFETHGRKLSCRPGGESGTTLLIKFDAALSGTLIESKAEAFGIKLMATRECYRTLEPPKNEFLISFCNLEEAEIEEAIANFCRALTLD